jgi:hypothetical protein
MKGEDVLCNLLLPKTKKVKSYQQRVTNRPSITNKKKKKKKKNEEQSATIQAAV